MRRADAVQGVASRSGYRRGPRLAREPVYPSQYLAREPVYPSQYLAREPSLGRDLRLTSSPTARLGGMDLFRGLCGSADSDAIRVTQTQSESHG